MFAKKVPHQLISLSLTLLFLVNGLTLPVTAQNGKPVIISFGQPNIWSLEQAHYLLARLRAQSLGLQSKELGTNDLDPNEINGTRLQTLKTLLGIGVGFNQTAGFQNAQATKELQFNQDRRHQLLAFRDQRQAELHTVNNELVALRVDREKMNGDTSNTEAAKKLKDVEIEQKVQQQTQLNNEVTSLTAEINGIPASTTALATPSPPAAEASPLPNGVVDQLLGSDGFKNELNGSPKLDASTRLDNYLNLQYEIIAKQLTSLRDEVGPHQRLVFLELPQSFYTVPDKSNRKLAQVWWRVENYFERPPAQEEVVVDKDCPNYQVRDRSGKLVFPNAENSLGSIPSSQRFRCNPHGTGRPRTEKDIFSDADKDAAHVADGAVRAVDLIPRQSALNVNDIQDKQKKFNLMGLFTWLSGLGVTVDYQREQRLYQQFLQQDVYASAFGKGARDFGWTFGPRPGTERIAPGLQTTYAILVVPDTAEGLELKAKGCYFPRTGYAPNNFAETQTDSQSNNLQCPGDNDFKLVIPSTSENNFWVTGLDYRSVRPGERATVYVRGDYFSPQIGVLVNGVALRHSVGLAQAELALPKKDNGFEPTPIGDFEFVNSKLLILSFSIPNFKGTPTISLVTPGRARFINDLRIVINDSYKCSKGDVGQPNCRQKVENGKPKVDDDGNKIPDSVYKKISEDKNVSEEHSIWVKLDDQPAMFSETSPAPVLTIENLKVFAPEPAAKTFTANLIGSKLSGKDQIQVNGMPIICKDAGGKTVACDDKAVKVCEVQRTAVKCPKLVAPGLIQFEFPATNTANLDITVIHIEKKPDDSVYSSKSFPNPFALRVDKATVIGYQPNEKPFPLLTVELEGAGFSSGLRADAIPIAKVSSQSQSATTMVIVLQLLKPDTFITITLSDPKTGVPPIPVVVTRPEEPKKEVAQNEEQKPAETTKPQTRKPKKRVR